MMRPLAAAAAVATWVGLVQLDLDGQLSIRNPARPVAEAGAPQPSMMVSWARVTIRTNSTVSSGVLSEGAPRVVTARRAEGSESR